MTTMKPSLRCHNHIFYLSAALVFLVPLPAMADQWCTTISYSAALASGMNRNFGAGVSSGTQAQQCYSSSQACESARQSASSGVSTTPCAHQGAQLSPGFSKPSANTVPHYNWQRNSAPQADDDDNAPLVDAHKIDLEQPWEPPATCVAKFPKMSDIYAKLLSRRKIIQDKIDAHVVRCSGIESGSATEAFCNKEAKSMQPEINAYLKAVQPLNETDRNTCQAQLAKLGNSPITNNNWTSGLNCAMADIYDRANSFGDSGKQFADGLRHDVTALQKSPPPVPDDADAVAIGSLSESNMVSLHKALPAATPSDSGTQLIVDLSVFRHGSDGSTSIQAVSAFLDAANHRTDERTTIMVYDKTGHLIDGDYPSSVQHCISAQ